MRITKNQLKQIIKEELASVMGEKKFPDLTGDGKVTRADILKGRGVIDEEEDLSDVVTAAGEGAKLEEAKKEMKLNKSYIEHLISEQLQEIKSGVQRGSEAIQPEEMPGAIAGLQANAAAQEAIAGLSQQTLMQVMQIAGQSQDPAAQQIVALVQGALEQVPEVAEEASKNAVG